MLTLTQGNLFDSHADALVNPVNTEGVMSKGLALQFKLAFPESFAVYRRACRRGEVQPGRMLVFATGAASPPRFIINFPTKRHWREPSRMEDIEAGLEALAEEIKARGIRSVAIPALGCGLGGLAWGEVRPRIERALAHLEEVDIRLYVPEPSPAVSLDEVNRRPAPCRRCGDRFTVVLPAGRSELERLARIPRDRKAELLRVLRLLTGCSLADAKGTVQHLAPNPGTCHRCSQAIPPGLLLVDCPSCGSLNLQLDGA